MNNTPQKQNINSDTSTSAITNEKALNAEIHQKTNDIKSYNDQLEKTLEDLKNSTPEKTKKSELTESLQVAGDSKELDSIEKDFDAALIDIYADISGTSEEDN
ncbi:MAG: hypothetical protein K9M11_04835 [Candidatus Pacebacteria bacterium]|nr:hypothetical protein [Candidatus Paceibacterota bacterium]